MYKAYIQSQEWKEFAAKVRKHYGFKCYVCGGRGWHVHHHSYNDYKSKDMSQYSVLCEKHHLRGAMDINSLHRYRSNLAFRSAILWVLRQSLKLLRGR